MTDKSSEIIWRKEGSWYLEVSQRTLPTGEIVSQPCVRHPGAVVLVPFSGPNEVIMLRQYRHTLDQTILEFPAGTRGWGEEWLVCAQRELREEIGFRAAEFESLGAIWPAPGVSDEVLQLFAARTLTADPLPQDVDEQIELVTLPLDEVVLMALDGRLQDGKSTAAALRAHYRLQP